MKQTFRQNRVTTREIKRSASFSKLDSVYSKVPCLTDGRNRLQRSTAPARTTERLTGRVTRPKVISCLRL